MGLVELEQPDGTLQRVFCKCRILWWERANAEKWARFSRMPHAVTLPTLDDFEAYSDPGRWAIMDRAIKMARNLIASPMDSKWMTLIGGVGTGKTMLLHALYRELQGYVIYLGGGEITRRIFQSFDDQSTEELMAELASVPVLLIDDLGVDETWNQTIRNKVTQIIDNRYQYGRYRPTVVATNLMKKDLESANLRVADRVLDEGLVNVFVLTLPSYRRRTEAENTASAPPPVVRRRSK